MFNLWHWLCIWILQHWSGHWWKHAYQNWEWCLCDGSSWYTVDISVEKNITAYLWNDALLKYKNYLNSIREITWKTKLKMHNRKQIYIRSVVSCNIWINYKNCLHVTGNIVTDQFNYSIRANSEQSRKIFEFFHCRRYLIYSWISFEQFIVAF